MQKSNTARSTQMIQCLRQNWLYSEKRMRDILFKIAQEVVDAQPSLIVSKLTREVANLASQRSPAESGNWQTSAKGVVNTMLRAGVLLGEDALPILPGVGALAAKVIGLKQGFEPICEAYLLEFLILKMGDVSAHDHKALAHALFRQFDPNVAMDDLEDHVAILIATLSESIALADSGIYVAGPGSRAEPNCQAVS